MNEGDELIARRRTRASRLVIGGALIAVSVLALVAPFATGTWSLQFLGLFPLAVGIGDLRAVVTDPQRRASPAAYVTGALAIAVAFLLYVSPVMLLGGLVIVLLAILAIDGVWKIGQAIIGRPATASRTISVLNGLSSLCLALLGWAVWKMIGGPAAIGVAIAGYTATAGWRMVLAPDSEQQDTDAAPTPNVHPDAKLGLGEHALFGSIRERLSASRFDVWPVEIYWMSVVVAILLAIHLGRMQSEDTWLGLISPFVATVGDVIMAVALGTLLVLPLRLVWRRLTRPLERKAWQLRLSGQDADMAALPRGLLQAWTDARYSFSASLKTARASLPSAGQLIIRLGIPLAVFFAAFNPIWGANWYFDTESWASAFYQKVSEVRVDTWRASMVDAVTAAYDDKSDTLFQIAPPGTDGQDFSFIVIGDTGEGDGSQYSLADRYRALGERDDIKFLIISSDVIYPAGAMKDYENNFYLPFKGFNKPIYAIPGNHDWFDALEAFNANFLEPKAARAALAARASADFNLTSTDEERIDRLLQRAKRLRDLYHIRDARQRAPFFELQTSDFALVAIDTGIRRTIDDRQLTWLKGALERSKGKFIMAIVGHPKYAGGHDTTIPSSYGTTPESAQHLLSNDAALSLRDLYAMLERAGAQVLMAGDTHDFEYYLQEPDQGQNRQPAHYFVNGGGGAYLSIGGALAWPEPAPTRTWAYYPGTKAIYEKLETETPAWKWPVWFWIKHFGAWPLSVEALSSIFDFNYAPFYQSFVEVRVERSKNRVVFVLQGVDGPVGWRDLDIAPGRLGEDPDAPVEFTVQLKRP